MKTKTAPSAAVPSLGMAILVRYCGPTNSKGSRWLATLNRDCLLNFKASHPFTYDGKDNDGADLAAAACLAKFETWCKRTSPELTFNRRIIGRIYIQSADGYVYVIA